MNRIEIRGVIVPSGYDNEWMKPYIERGIVTPESYVRRKIDEASKKQPLNLYINSPGGSVFSAYEIINTLMRWKSENKKPVNITIGAMAASAASAIAVLSKANLSVHRNSKIMFHGAWTETVGGKEAHADVADLLDKINADIKAELVSRFGMSPELVDSWFAEGRQGWMTAQDAVSYGMASEVVDADDEEVEPVDDDLHNLEEQGLAIAAMFGPSETVAAVEEPVAVAEVVEPEALADESEDEGEQGEQVEQTDEEQEAQDEDSEPDEDVPASDDNAGGDDADADSGVEEGQGDAGEEPVGATQENPASEVERLAALRIGDTLAEHAARFDEMQKRCQAAELLARKHQGERDAEVAAHAKTKSIYEGKLAEAKEALDKANARLCKLTLGSLTYSPAIESWEEAMRACNGDYAEARKKYPDAWRSFMSNNQTKRN